MYECAIYVCVFKFAFLIYNYKAIRAVVFVNRIYNFKLQIQTKKSQKRPIFAKFRMLEV